MRRTCCLGCLALACRSPAAPHHPGIAADSPDSVGRPPNPEPGPGAQPPIPARIPGPPSFHDHQECPPDVRGCILSRDVTSDAVATGLFCPGAHGFGRQHALRRLEITGVTADVGEGTPPADGLASVRVRAVIQAHAGPLADCFRDAVVTFRGELDLMIDRAGHASAGFATLPDNACVRDTLASITFPRRPAITFAKVLLAFVVEDPRSAASAPLVCP